MVLLALFATDVKASDFAAERRQMLEELQQLTVATAAETGRSTLDPRVLDAMGKVPREEFVPPKQAGSAYNSRPLSIGYGQTISQPFIVALMTELLNLKPTDKVLWAPDKAIRPPFYRCWPARYTRSKSYRSWARQRPQR